jgi:hypothetical protein
MFGSYVRHAEDALESAKLTRAQRELSARGLRRATEHVCKAVRVANNQSATRSHDIRALLLGGDAIDALADARWRERIEPMIRLSELAIWTDTQLAAWTSALEAIVDELDKVEPPVKPPTRMFRLSSRSTLEDGRASAHDALASPVPESAGVRDESA